MVSYNYRRVFQFHPFESRPYCVVSFYEHPDLAYVPENNVNAQFVVNTALIRNTTFCEKPIISTCWSLGVSGAFLGELDVSFDVEFFRRGDLRKRAKIRSISSGLKPSLCSIRCASERDFALLTIDFAFDSNSGLQRFLRMV